ncbi:hypothetical protein ACWGH3_01960 [Streptomyces sp. NPDC054884]|uniref:hypothetical protein n=1 Tax=unclassified Streptomyces TaxID=2593676 RepID=UPI0029BC7313|nr:hypothetical protein [Streptomyces sp. ME08-AFT2]MDX3310433.1 hypothetical protein [Streptomyces sp. ME08-AFT2]
MRTTAKRLTAVAGGLVMAAGALTVGTASNAAAATCYEGAVSKTFNMGTDEAEHRFGPYTTTSRCNDINLKITSWGNASPLLVRVCFHPASGGTTCNSWKEFYKSSDLNKWRVIASDVKNGTRYSVSLDFASNTFRGALAH